MWLVGVVSRRRVWLVGVGRINGYGYWVWLEVYQIDFLILLIPTHLVSVLFYSSAHPYFLFFFKMFFVLVPVLFVITFYVLNNFFTQYNTHKGNYGRPKAAV